MIIDFTHNKNKVKECIIHGESVDIVKSHKYLGTVFDDQLKWDLSTAATETQGRQRIHLLRKLNRFSFSPVILCLFYQSFMENLWTFSFISQPDIDRQKQFKQYC